MSPEEKHEWTITEIFRQCKFDDEETRPIPTKNQNRLFRGQVNIRIQLQTFPWKLNKKKFHPEPWSTDEWKSFEITMQQPRDWIKRGLYPSLSLLSEKYLSTRSQTRTYLKNFDFFLVFSGHKLNSDTNRAPKDYTFSGF